MKKKNQFKTFIKGGLTVLTSVLIIYGVVQAGTITPPSGTPSAQFYTLSEIYEFITNNTAATEGTHDFTFSDSLAGTGHTLTEIYNALANLISADKVKLGTTYLGTAGTLVPSGGTATTTDVCSGAIYFGAKQTDWNPATGVLTIDASKVLSGVSYCGTAGTMANNGSFNLTCTASDQSVAAGYYSGGTLTGDADLISSNIKNGINLFGIDGDGNVVDTSGGTVTSNTQIRSGYVCFSDGTQYTGSIDDCASEGSQSCYATGNYYASTNKTQTITPSTSSQIITQGYHDGTGYCEGDADLAEGNIANGVNIFGITGNLISYSFGSNDASQVLTSATGKGTYDASNLTESVVKLGTTFAISSTGELTPASGASESLTLTAANAVCGSKYFGSGASSWTVQSGTGCSTICQECSAGSCVNMSNDTQDTTNDFGIGTCDQTCKKCSGGACANQASNEDLFAQCSGSSCCGYCNGSGACAYVANGSTCTSPGDACNGSVSDEDECNGSGVCVRAWTCEDNLTFTYRGGSVTYGTISHNSECWLDRNLGASQVAGSSTDSAAYGDLFQWGRLDDGHQDRTSTTTDTKSSTDNPGHSNFITGGNDPYDWRDPQNDNLWQGASGTNNPCPDGWRIPTETEWNTEMTSWSSQDSAGAFGSPLKLTVAGYRSYGDGSLIGVDTYGLYWSSTVSTTDARYLFFSSSDAAMNSRPRANGFSVRCLKD